MSTRFLVVPQWQGSGSSRAMRLVDGAAAIRGDLPSAVTTLVEVPLEAGDEQGTGIARASSLLMVRDNMRIALGTAHGPVVTIGGDCGVELGAVEHVLGEDVAVVWFDAHPDLNTPASSPSGAFCGMVLRTLLGDGDASFVPAARLAPDHVVLVGARSLDPAEEDYLASSDVVSLGVDGLDSADLVAAVAATGAASVYVHIDLDVLDPAEFLGLEDPQPFGMGAGHLVELVRALRARFPLAGAGITSFAPASAEEAVNDLPTVLRIVGALTS